MTTSKYICAKCAHTTDHLTPLSGTLGRLGRTIPTCPECSSSLLRHDVIFRGSRKPPMASGSTTRD